MKISNLPFFGLVLAVPTTDLAGDPHFCRLGAEPLEPAFDGGVLARAARGRRGPVKPFLLDARVVVGVGNIYASEALHRAGIHPVRSVRRVSAASWERLAEAVKDVLAGAIEVGGTTLNDFTDGDGQAGYFQVSLSVYDREGEPCTRCAGSIRRWPRRMSLIVDWLTSIFLASCCWVSPASARTRAITFSTDS